MLKIGHGAAQLPILLGEPLGGYADRRQGADGTIDALEVHSLVIEDGVGRTALVVVDLVCVNTDVVEAVRADLKAQFDIAITWLLATHTHSGPEAGCHPGGGVTEPHLAERLRSAVRESVEKAGLRMRPAELVVARALIPDLATKRTSEEPTAMQVPIDLITVNEGQDTVGILAVCPVHPTVLPADNRQVSADLSGGIRRALRRLWPARRDGTAPWAVVATGAAGDISTRFSRQARSTAELDRLGALTAERLLTASTEALNTRVADGPVRHAEETLTLHAGHGNLEVDAATAHTVTSRSAHVLRQGLDIARQLQQRPRTSHTLTVEALRIGPLTLVGVPAELFLELGESIRVGSRGPVVVLGYANGYLGYLPTHDAASGYEVLVSPVVRGSGELVAATCRALVQRLDETFPAIAAPVTQKRLAEPEPLGG